MHFFSDCKNSGRMIYRFLREVLPCVDRELSRWQAYAEQNMRGQLQKQALSSIRAKRFHCQGGGFYALYPEVRPHEFVAFVVALQTISDYLDNLCDRASVTSQAAFERLHLAMTDALDPAAPMNDYYADYPFKDDGGYLERLVSACRKILASLPGYPSVKDDLLKLAALYSRLQATKHIEPAEREQAMRAWLAGANKIRGLSDWEFAAASGSTLGMFALAAAAYRPNLTRGDAKKIKDAYFPWISCLHIQLDYFVDQEEDRQNGDLNFIFYYDGADETARRLPLIYQNALDAAAATEHPYFARTIARGLPALYLSDPKIQAPPEKEIRSRLLSAAGLYSRALYELCKLLRRRQIL